MINTPESFLEIQNNETTPSTKVLELTPDNKFVLFNKKGKYVGTLDFSGDKIDFTGEATEAAVSFFDGLSRLFDTVLAFKKANDNLKEKPNDS